MKRSKPYRPAEVRRFHDWVASLPCLVTGEHGVTLHHVTGYADRAGRFIDLLAEASRLAETWQRRAA